MKCTKRRILMAGLYRNLRRWSQTKLFVGMIQLLVLLNLWLRKLRGWKTMPSNFLLLSSSSHVLESVKYRTDFVPCRCWKDKRRQHLIATLLNEGKKTLLISFVGPQQPLRPINSCLNTMISACCWGCAASVAWSSSEVGNIWVEGYPWFLSAMKGVICPKTGKARAKVGGGVRLIIPFLLIECVFEFKWD